MNRFLARLSLRTRLIAALLIVLLAVLVIGGAYTLKAAWTVGADTLRQMAGREAQVLVLALTEPLILSDYTAAEQQLRKAVASGSLAWARLVDNSHTITAIAKPPPAQRPDWFARLLGLDVTTMEQPIVVGGRHYGTVVLGVPPTTVEESLWQLLSRITVSALGASVLLALLMSWIMRSNLQGLQLLARRGESLAAGEGGQSMRLPDHAPPELIATTQALDAAYARIHAQMIEITAEKERWRVTLESLDEGVIVTDEAGAVRFMNPAAEQLTGWSESEALGRPVEAVVPILSENQRQPAFHPLRTALRSLATVSLPGEGFLRTREEVLVPIVGSAAPIHTADGQSYGALLVLRNESERRAMLAELRRLAFHDPLTGLPNRRALEGRIERALQQLAAQPSRQHVLGYIDLDQFKLVNDTCGHAAGDELLGQIAGIMRATLPPATASSEPAVLGRLGGDEFGLLLFDTGLEDAVQLGERLIAAIQGYTHRHNGRSFNLGASIGLIQMAAGDEAGQILARADAACYLAKRKGRNRVEVWLPEHPVLQIQSEEMEWIGRLERYFAEGRFQLWRQCIAPLTETTRTRDGYFEILLRYVDEHGEVRSPQIVLSAAERYGLAISLDRWVMRRLAEHLQKRPEDTARYAVNLSALSLSDAMTVEFVQELFAHSGLAPERFQFELTETAVMHDIATARRFMQAMRDLGCRLALDDFGAGMSSFAYLKELPVDTLKIDGGFVRHVDAEPLDYVIVNAIAQIGRDMGLKTVAECVETANILDKLREIGVDYAQGYHIHRPEPYVVLRPMD